MKTIFTFIAVVTLSVLGVNKANSQNCGNSYASAGTPVGLTMDGNMSDWTGYLAQVGNNAYDNTLGIDLDAPIADAGRDLVRFAFTEDAQNLYIFLERAGSTANSVDIVFYIDINNNDLMESREPVYHINWGGSNGNVSIAVKDYNPSLLGNLVNTLSLNLDGTMLMGTLSHRGNSGPGSSQGRGSNDGRAIEIKIPFTQITRQNSSGNVIDQLAYGEDFKFHVSTINGSIGSIPGANSINDNFGSCMNGPDAVLPVKLSAFNATLNTISNKVDLKWITSFETNLSHFVIEKSNDGQNFSDAGTVFAYGNTSEASNYSFTDNLGTQRSGVVYYRLRSVDQDGSTGYSAIRAIRLDKNAENTVTILTYPNPVASELKVTIPAGWQNKRVMYELFQVNGQSAKKFETASSSQTETINLVNLQPGMYFVRVSCEGQVAQQKIIKN